MLREKFEVVLIVGDPILTGIAATVIAPQADGLILAVRHGQKPALVHHAVRQVEMLGTGLAAAVFNHADPAELPIDVKAREAAAVAQHRAFPEKVRRLGPLVTSVLASISHTRAEDVELISELDVTRNDDTTNQGAPTDEAHERRARGRDAA
jgi:hypothetical protein